MKTKVAHRLFFILVIAAILLSGCKSTETPTKEGMVPTEGVTAADETPEVKDTPVVSEPTMEDVAEENIVVYASSTTYPNLYPSASVSNENIVLANVYELLVYYTPEGSDEILSPGLAERWESNEDGTQWTFYLREGVKFHDGTDFNAEAVKYSIERTKEYGGGFAYIWDPVEEIVAVDDLTVQFNLQYSAALDLIAASTYAAWIYSPSSADKDEAWFNEGNDVGTGPYMMASYEIGQRLVLDRFDEYWGEWASNQFDKVVFEPVEDPIVRQQMIEAGEADVTIKLPRENLDALDALPDVTVYTFPSLTNLQGLFNTSKPPLDNALVRQALSYSFPYDDVINGVMQGYASQAHGPVPVGIWGGHSSVLFQYEYDIDKAKDLLEQAGYGEGGFELLLTYATGDLDEQQLAELWKAELTKLNIDLTVQAMAWEAQWDLAKAGKEDPANAQDIIIWYWWPDVVTPYSMLYGQIHCGAVYNMVYYCNEELDEQMDNAAMLTGSDKNEADKLFLEVEEFVIDEALMVYIYDMNDTTVLRSDLSGYVPNPNYAEVVFFYNMTR